MDLMSKANVLHSRRAGDSKLVLPGGNAVKKCDDEFNVKIFRISPAPNQCCHVAAVQVTMSSPDLRLCIVEPTPTVKDATLF
jgi:hypothetical protein